MTPDELDHQITELSTRLERLRSLYEQYFMGIERMEPGVARKDLERRVQELRKTRFPTTAKRFKFQTLIQRYNSLQQYWVRTCREIENGTYRKHRIKAARRFGDKTTSSESRGEKPQAADSEKAKSDAAADLDDLLDIDVDLDAEFKKVVKKLESLPPSPVHSKLAPSPKPKGLAGLSSVQTSSSGSPRPQALKPLRGRKISSFPKAGNTVDVQAPRPAKLPDLSPGPLEGKVNSPSVLSAQPQAAQKTPERPSRPLSRKKKNSVKPPSRRAKKALPSTRSNPTSGLSEDRIRSLHATYSEARSKTNAKAVSFEKMAKSIRETERKLRSKNKNRSVEFEVKIKDGKAILKPKLK